MNHSEKKRPENETEASDHEAEQVLDLALHLLPGRGGQLGQKVIKGDLLFDNTVDQRGEQSTVMAVEAVLLDGRVHL